VKEGCLNTLRTIYSEGLLLPKTLKFAQLSPGEKAEWTLRINAVANTEKHLQNFGNLDREFSMIRGALFFVFIGKLYAYDELRLSKYKSWLLAKYGCDDMKGFP
jgi:hypothetical protein